MAKPAAISVVLILISPGAGTLSCGAAGEPILAGIYLRTPRLHPFRESSDLAAAAGRPSVLASARVAAHWRSERPSLRRVAQSTDATRRGFRNSRLPVRGSHTPHSCCI